MMRRTRALLAALITTAALSLVACSSHSDWDIASPAAWGPSWGGQTYCGYIVTPLECTGHPGIPMQMPTTAPAGYYPGMTTATDLMTALFLQHLIYHSFYASPRYYNQYVPSSYRANYTTVYVAPFDRRYSTAERSAESRAVYRNSKGSTIPSSKVNTTKLTTQQPRQQATKPATTKAPSRVGSSPRRQPPPMRPRTRK